jgi:general stress protein CsbA
MQQSVLYVPTAMLPFPKFLIVLFANITQGATVLLARSATPDRLATYKVLV